MSQTPEEIRADIERTRQDLGTDVDALADKVSPSGIAQRQTDKVKDGIRRARENVMGTADEATGGARDALHQAGQAVQDTPGQALRQTRGNPLAAGLIAFGVGLLVSSLVPPSEAERQAAQAVKEKAEPLTHEVADAAQHVAEDLKEPARQAAEHVKAAATEGTRHVKDDAQTAAQDLKASTTEATDTVRDTQGT